MKLIIDIPEETKRAFDKAESNDLKGGYYDHGGVIGKAIQNGIPLDDVKAEIEKLDEGITSYHNDKPWVYKSEVLDIIEKYKGVSK